MAFPTGWPPRPASGVRSIRFFVSGTGTANWSDNAYLFVDDVGANTFQPTPYVPPGSSGPGVTAAVGDRSTPGSPMGTGENPNDVLPGETVGNVKKQIWSNTIRIINDGGGDLQFSFAAPDDTSTLIQGVVKANEELVYRQRHEAGIALRGAGVNFRVEAW